MFFSVYLNLHLEMNLKVGQQGQEDGQRELKNLRHRGNAIFGQRHAEILLDGVGKHIMSTEHWAGTLQQRKQQLKGNNLRPQLMGPEMEKKSVSISNTYTHTQTDTHPYIHTVTIHILPHLIKVSIDYRDYFV